MTSRAFSCNGALIRKNLSRFWLLSLGLLVILTLKGLSFFSEISLRLTTENRLEEMIDRLYWDKHVGIELISSILIAALMFSYLHQKRSSSFFGRDSPVATQRRIGILRGINCPHRRSIHHNLLHHRCLHQCPDHDLLQPDVLLQFQPVPHRYTAAWRQRHCRKALP